MKSMNERLKSLRIEISEHLDVISSIYSESVSNFRCSETLYNLSVDKLKPPPGLVSPQLFFICDSLKKHLIILLDKLFYDKGSQAFNLHKFLRRLESHKEYAELGFTTDKIAGWAEELKKNTKAIEEIHRLRDKVFGHTDKDYMTHLSNFELSDIEIQQLFDTARKIIIDACAILGLECDLNTFYSEHLLLKELKQIHSQTGAGLPQNDP